PERLHERVDRPLLLQLRLLAAAAVQVVADHPVDRPARCAVIRAVGLAWLAAIAAAGCTGDIDPPWQLSHDRIVAVRADPPGIAPGQTSRIDALLAHKGEMTSVATPELAMVTSPSSLGDVLTISGGTWTVTAPDEDRLAAARSELQLAAGAPVPLQIGVSY